MRVATYTRISTDEVNQPYSLGAQSERLASYVKSQDDWELVASFTDQISGAKLERPGLGKALAAAAAGRFDLLLVYRVDRLSRSVRGLAQVLEDLDTAGVAFRSATEPFDTASPAGRMMVQMLGVFAEFERATIIDRVIAGMERKAAQGNWCGGHEPFGYRVVKGEGRLSADEDEAPLVELVFDLYVHKRLGSHAIANRLNASGLRTRAGRPWSYKAILTMLRNRTYLGFVHFRDVWTKGEHRPLVPEPLFDGAQALLVERGEDVAKRAANGSDYLLTGLVVCGHCRRHFTGTAARGRNATYRYYTCAGRQRYGTDTCGADRLPAGALDDAIVAALVTTFSDTDLFARAAAEARGRAGADGDRRDAELVAIDVELHKAEAGIDRYLRAFESGSMPESVCGKRLKALGDQADALRARRQELADATDADAVVTPTEDDLTALRDLVADAVANGSPAAVKALLQALVHEIRVDSRHAIQPIFRLPTLGERSGERLGEPEGEGAVRAPSSLVGVLARYSRMALEAELLKKVLAEPLLDEAPCPPRLAKQQQKRLTGEELVAFCDAYRARVPIKDLAAEFGINRMTVMDLASRHGLPRRYPVLSPDQVVEAARLYQAGRSLASIATVLPASPDAIGDALTRTGVRLRQRPGWPPAGNPSQSPIRGS